jgi:hypothetical protein
MRTSLLLVLVASICCIDTASAWGKVGHEMVANIAYKRLSNPARQMVHAILGTTNNTEGSPLAAVADWADRVRYTKTYSWTTPLHFIDIHDQEIPGGCPALLPGATNTTSCTFDYARDCEHDFCVAGAIANFSSYISRRGALRGDNKWRLKESLMFVTHFVGDIHQPLHCARGSDKGGNTIHVHFNITNDTLGQKKGEWNLHSVWDDGIIDRALVELYEKRRENFEDDLFRLIENAEKSGDIEVWLDCADGRNKTCTSEWAEESLDDALVWAYRNSDDTEVVEGSEISKSYYESRLAVARRRIAAAGVRLAATLELAFAGRKVQSFGELVFAFMHQMQM